MISGSQLSLRRVPSLCTSKFLCLGHPVITAGKGRGSSVQVKAVVDEWQSSSQDMGISYVEIVTIWVI